MMANAICPVYAGTNEQEAWIKNMFLIIERQPIPEQLTIGYYHFRRDMTEKLKKRYDSVIQDKTSKLNKCLINN